MHKALRKASALNNISAADAVKAYLFFYSPRKFTSMIQARL